MARATGKPFHSGLTPDLVVDAAAGLTRESHLMSWSIRDLAARLGVAPSVVYHHVGGKDLLCRQVAERVVSAITVPDTRLDWQPWFRELLLQIGPLAAGHPGVAGWMLLHGPTVPAALPTLEAGMERLRSAGFGRSTTSAYALLMNTAMLTVSIGDDRLRHEGDGPRDHATMMAEFRRMPGASAAAREWGQELMGEFVAGPEAAERARWSYYRFAVDVTIAGLATTLAAVEP